MFDAKKVKRSTTLGKIGCSDRFLRGFGMRIQPLTRTANIPAILLCAAIQVLAASAHAQGTSAIIEKGDAVVTGFSGVKIKEPVPETVHPLDRTSIDLDGTSAEVLDLTTLGTAPRGQVSDTVAKLKIKARETGQIFGVALDDGTVPNAYATATSMYALQIVEKKDNGDFERLVEGGPKAEWMPGQFGPGGPGAIYKIDGETGEVTLFATIKTDGRENAGPALGNIAYDPKSKQLFVSDLETGLIHRLSLDGKDRGTFDHGVTARTAQGLDAIADDESRHMDIKSNAFQAEDPATWGYADARRRVFGVAISKDRIYYAVTEGPSVWSVSLTDQGDFGDDPRIELEPKGTTSNADITDIVFDGAGVMIISQRGAITGNYDYTTFATPQQSSVLRYTWSEREGRWTATPDEYAIGLKTNHYATQGGVALSYGYDKFGNVDYGACRQTVWTTGEHLREGDDLKLVSSGGAKYVTGLQGNYKIRLRPENAPPVESWFVDYDSRFEDASAFGHQGDVAIHAPCQPEGSAPPPADWEVIPPIMPPPDEPFLTLDKVCHPGAIGGKIRCTISVSNISPTPLVDDVKIDDVTKTMFGPAAGAVVPIVAAAPLDPGIICSPTPTPDFFCTVPAALLLPGDIIAIDVWVDTHDLALAGNLGFRNCATLHHPSGNLKACAEGGTDIVVEKVGPGFCLPGLTCKFGLKIINAGAMPYNGDVLLADAMFVGGAVKNAAVTAVNPPIPCSAGDTNQLPFTCVTTLSLMPGEEQTHWIDVTMPAPGGYWAQNCFGALDPALLPLGPVPPGMAPGGGANPSCVWVHVPVPQQNLKLTKTALNGGKCAKTGDNLDCDFEIKVTNLSLLPFSGPVKIDETVPAGATITAVTPPWICNGGPPNYVCDTAAVPVNIAPGASVAFNVTLSTTAAASEANLCKVPNKAKITTPVAGVAPNLDPTDDESDAQGMTLGLAWVDPITGITWVMCDPTNLKVEKSAHGDCEAKGNNKFECGYDVTVTNMGPDPYQGPVKLDETFGTAPQNATFDGDFTCNGGGANYQCATSGAVTLAKGESLTLKVKATVNGDTCALPNTAKMTAPPVGSKGNGDGSDDQASATANVPSKRCGRPSDTPPPTRCPDGKPIPRSGKCPCPVGTTWDRETYTCFDEEPDEPEDCTPGPNEIRTASGRCICARDYERNSVGRCVLIDDGPDYPLGCVPGPNEIKTGSGRCVCRPGFSRNRKGLCVRDENPADDCREQGGTWRNGRCIFPPKECPPGTTGKYPDCRTITPTPPVVPPKVCPPGTIGKYPKCKTVPKVCPPGTRGRYPNCKDIPKLCPPGTVGKYPNCRKVPKNCPPGMIGKPPNCILVKPPKLNINPDFIKPKPVRPQRTPGPGPSGGGFTGGGFTIKKF